jgi:hypothetical protein
MDFSALMEESETITEITSITSETRGGGTSDLLIDDSQINGQTVEMYIAGGTDYKVYRIEVLIATSKPEILQGDGLLKITDK